MKKIYSKPSLKVCPIETETILAGSNVKTMSAPHEDENNTNIGGFSNGGWGRTDNPD